MSLLCSRLGPGALVSLLYACGSDAATAVGTSARGTLSFDACAGASSCTLELEPGQVVDVGLEAPASVSTISVALDGDYGDGALQSQRAATTDGHGSVTLRAPTSPANFYLVASANKLAVAKLYVAVSASGFARVRVTPQYGGHRPVSSVVASAFLKASCRDLGAVPAKDGAPVAVGGSGDALLLEGVPAGGHVAVAVRVGHYAFGCVDIDALPPDATRDVSITVYDRPIDLAQTELDTTLTFAPGSADADAWRAAMALASAQALEALSPAGDEGTRLLDGMAAAANPADHGAFVSARSGGQWDSVAGAWLASHGGLRVTAGGWLTTGIATTQKDLLFRLKASAQQGYADVSPTRLGPLVAASAGLTAPVPFSWVADAEDSVHLAGSIAMSPTKLVAAAADGQAVNDVPQSTGVASALAVKVDCKGFGDLLASKGTAFAACNASCVQQLCQTSLASAWKAAGDVSATRAEQTVLALTATVQATVGDAAEPQSFSGAWLGQVQTPTVTFSSKGVATATHP